MKKILTFCALAIMMLCTVSCGNSIKFLYNVSAVGDADGQVALNFPNGSFETTGTATLNFIWANNPVNSPSWDLEKIRNLNDKKFQKAVAITDEWIENAFSVSAAKGTYQIRLKGELTITELDITVSFDKTLTNRNSVIE